MSIKDLQGEWADAQATRFSANGQVQSISPKFCAAAEATAEQSVAPAAKIDEFKL